MAEIIRFRVRGGEEKASGRASEKEAWGERTVINHKLHELVAAEDKLAPKS